MEAITAHIGRWMKERDQRGGTDTSLAIRQGGQSSLQLSFLGAIGTDEYLFRLAAENRLSDDAILRQHFSLTQRESEVLLWIAKGKANRDIGEILGLSAGVCPPERPVAGLHCSARFYPAICQEISPVIRLLW
ncbi:hypothetical protein GCM10011491_29180 [Brucella endophytica]|uniref:HTH luxR-type domain-containing protein n=1 Tax=Brucella endophytica TaxID=1963359 RepID=A0A916SIF6_9HYPH|nr:hypothetical protein GCM10011491_29180 [Brucella endophytica]